MRDNGFASYLRSTYETQPEATLSGEVSGALGTFAHYLTKLQAEPNVSPAKRLKLIELGGSISLDEIKQSNDALVQQYREFLDGGDFPSARLKGFTQALLKHAQSAGEYLETLGERLAHPPSSLTEADSSAGWLHAQAQALKFAQDAYDAGIQRGRLQPRHSGQVR